MGASDMSNSDGGQENGWPPHQHKRAAVFIDADNILIGAREAGFKGSIGQLMDHAREQWFIMSARAYGDWTKPTCQGSLREFQLNSVEMTQLPSGARGKNTADIMLAVDATEMVLLDSSPDVVVLAAADRDFVPLAQKLRRYGKEVVGIGVRGSVSEELRIACNKFTYLDDIVVSDDEDSAGQDSDTSGAGEAEGRRGEAGIDVPFRHLGTAVSESVNPSGYALGSVVANRMRQLMPGFAQKDYGYSTFLKFCLAARDRKIVQVFNPKVGDFRLSPFSDKPDDAELDLRFGTPEEAAEAYRQVLLADRKLPVIAWESRERLLNRLWQALKEAPEGLTLEEMSRELIRWARSQEMSQPDQALNKLVHTLNITNCFTDGTEAKRFRDRFNTPLRPARRMKKASEAVTEEYVRGIYAGRRGRDLMPEGLAELLYEDVEPEHVDEARQLIEKVSGSS